LEYDDRDANALDPALKLGHITTQAVHRTPWLAALFLMFETFRMSDFFELSVCGHHNPFAMASRRWLSTPAGINSRQIGK
jgi:hypothetical protein